MHHTPTPPFLSQSSWSPTTMASSPIPVHDHINHNHPPITKPALFLSHAPTSLATMAGNSADKPSGCGMLGMFRRRKPWHRRSSSTSSLPACNHDMVARSRSANSERRHPVADDTAAVVPPHLPGLPTARSAPVKYKPSAPANQVKVARKTPNSSKPLPGNGLSGELNSMIYDHQRAKTSGSLVRATSGNVMLYGNLGNIRGKGPSPPKGNVLDYLPNGKDGNGNSGSNGAIRNVGKNVAREPANGVMGNIMRNPAKEPGIEAGAPELCRALSRRLDPEELKKMGNEEYKKGRLAEALALYDRAIALNPGMASYRSNKAAALMGMGRLLEAVTECKEALTIDQSYCRAHHRLATLYLRLGEADKALHHYNLAQNEASSSEISQSKALQTNLAECKEARKLGDWNTVLKEAKSAVSAGADSAPQVFALQAEALLKLDRHDDAETVQNGAPKFDIDASTKFFGATKNAYALMIQAEVGMATGRFEDAACVAQKAAQLDPSNRETNTVVRRTQAAASARSKGNDLFKVSKFGDACTAYQEGLHLVPRNAILLCNRAACRSKLGQWERAIEDCNTALIVRPSYTKARLRRADCNAKLERWEASVRDYEVLINEIPGDEEVSRALSEAQEKNKKQRNKDERNVARS